MDVGSSAVHVVEHCFAFEIVLGYHTLLDLSLNRPGVIHRDDIVNGTAERRGRILLSNRCIVPEMPVPLVFVHVVRPSHHFWRLVKRNISFGSN